jgi:hypothetical protein
MIHFRPCIIPCVCLAMDKEKSNKHRDVGSIGQNREKKDIQTNLFKLSLSDKFLNVFCQYYYFLFSSKSAFKLSPS